MYRIISYHAIYTLFNYLKRVGSRIARPDRLNYEIPSSDYIPSFPSLEDVSKLNIVQAARCDIFILTLMLEAREL